MSPNLIASSAMASSGEHGAAKIKDHRLLLPFSFDQLRVPDELVQEMGSSNIRVFGLGPPAGIWPVEVEKDGDGAFLGRGWPEVAAASGAGEGWFLVLRHHGQGLLTIKGFDRSCCFRVLGTPPAEVEANTSTITGPLKPKFIRGLTQDFMEKLLIPAEFVERYIVKEHLEHNMAILTGPVGEVCQVELETNQSSVVFTGGWSGFLSLQGITKGNTLVLKYERNMEFTVNIFEPNGFQRPPKHKNARIQQIPKLQDMVQVKDASPWNGKCKNVAVISNELKETKVSMTFTKKKSIRSSSFYKGIPSASSGKRKRNDDRPRCSKRQKRKIGSMTRCVIQIEPSAWIKRKINTSTIENRLYLSKVFCQKIGILEACRITLKTSMDSSTSWEVLVSPYKNSSHHITGLGWRRFYQENQIKVGDICTFNIVEATLWLAVITPSKI
ncbi:hypothetical protein QOZ80_4BG0358080 [Eleusine coracana subsp. coracana]|nr:hypothetical protein QOZ80_4BG0358080 [Eleusine coracana subsp. coracana]